MIKCNIFHDDKYTKVLYSGNLLQEEIFANQINLLSEDLSIVFTTCVLLIMHSRSQNPQN